MLLELNPLVLDFFDEDFQLNPRTIFTLDEGLNDPVEFISIIIETPVQISKLIEDELFSLSIFEEEKCN